MKVEVETTYRVLLNDADQSILLATLTYMMGQRRDRIQELRGKIERYERKREQERNAYQQMSAIRRWLAARTPEHHLAVEQLVYVKQPMMEIERLAGELSRLQRVAETAGADSKATLYIPAGCSQELLDNYEERGGKRG
ncbi:hypothetical protein PP175_18825 [Aneurinibacillus sp. Ricciae_BoGa-3]|uniref:hypothetical protein n=1 Tax=Aneurinibacillus sp. Ricciae_BoGa-3 TaxID=3022697 RepID=UPI00233FA4DF|nr:hypothetical protein [Aneurinibacillus sp. Ricciae_BoGa-3]WCK53389.1 hypothetical protein PP175_18825 [Aneurinibacillus sp. Ricciae_BoGa-3]